MNESSKRVLPMQFNAKSAPYKLTDWHCDYEVYRVWSLGLKYTASNIAIYLGFLCWRSIYKFTFFKDFTFGLRFDPKTSGIWRKKWRFEIWLIDLHPFLKIFWIWVKDLMWYISTASEHATSASSYSAGGFMTDSFTRRMLLSENWGSIL